MRANKRILCIIWVGLMIVSLAISSLFAQDAADKPATLKKIAGNIYQMENVGGGNILVCAGEDGILMVDTGTNPGDFDKMKAAIASISKKPVRYVINTHWHSDHTAANEQLGREGAVIVSHENVAKRMSSEQYLEFFDRRVPPSPKDAQPMITFSSSLTLHFNEDEIVLFHPEPGHTDGDAVVFFTENDVVHVGDLYFNGYYPYVGVSSGGSVTGMITVLSKVLEKIEDSTVVVPGHGPVSNKRELKLYVDMLRTIRDRIIPQIEAGKSLEDIIASAPTRDYDEKWGQVWMKGPDFVKLLYTDLVRSK